MKFELHHGDCLEIMRSMPDNSVDLILTDPPYFKVKDEPWDNQWAKPHQFLAWLDTVLNHFERILKPNGSLYLFASPKMAARVECLIGERFNVLNSIRWIKEAGWHKKQRKEDLRTYLQPWESLVFAEHFGADNIAKGEAGYAAKCDELRGFIFEPLRAYIAGEWERAGLTKQDANAATGTQMASHYLTTSQWALPTRENYEKLRAYANRTGGAEFLHKDYEFLRKDYEFLRKDYEELRQEFELLRRPFAVTADVQHTDLWAFSPVQPYAGKHPCEKPAAMLEHIITASSRPGAVVFDAFAGTGSTGIAAVKLGRHFIGCEMAEHHHRDAFARILAAMPAPANDNEPCKASAAA